MSRWQTTYESHQFHTSYKLLLNTVNLIKIEELTQADHIFEVSRIKKVIEFVETYLSLIDPELLSSNVAQNLNNLNSYFTSAKNEINAYNLNKNIAHLHNANSNLDNSIAHLKSFNTILPKFSRQKISSIINTYNSTIEKALKEINLTKVIEDSNEIKKLKDKLCIGTKDNKSIKDTIDNLYKQIETNYKDIKSFHEKLILGNESSKSIEQIINNTKENLEKNVEEIEEKIIKVSNQIDKLNKFYIKIFGFEEKENKKIIGLEEELNIRIQALDEFEKEQKKIYQKTLTDRINSINKLEEEINNRIEKTINEKLEKIKEYENNIIKKNNELYKKIESHLPFATTAGLAKAYEYERKRFTIPIITWNLIFIASLIGIFLISINHLNISTSNYQELGYNLIKTLPTVGPLIWLAIYSSIRRSESQRLEQEYAHKETLAKTYSGYKKQIESLNEDGDKVLLNKLLDNAIDTISKNASDSLDKKHGDGFPITGIMNKIMEEIKNLKNK